MTHRGTSGAAPVRKPRRGDVLELAIERLDPRGRGVGQAEGCLVRVRRGLPGSRVRALVQKRRGAEVQALLVEELVPAPHRIPARCPHFGVCGGCSFQDLDYPAQLAELGGALERLVRRLPGGERLRVDPVVGCEDPWRYRNKMEFTFGNRRFVEKHEPAGAPADFALGLHTPNRYDKVLDITTCPLQFAEGDAILASARELAREHGLALWDVREQRGCLRHLVLRKGVATGEILVALVTTDEEPAGVEALAAALHARHPEITTCVQLVNTRPAAIAVGERERVLFGPGVIHEELLGLSFALSAGSFFQTNTRQAERLFAIVREEARLTGAEVVFDLYCGAGAIALVLAPLAREVWGFEEVPSAVRDARVNAAANGCANARFVEGDVARCLRPEALAALDAPRADVVVLDPPRAGVHPDVVPALARLAPRRIVYVSCSPGNAVRDVGPLCAPGGGYRPVAARPIDLFPHTPHLECVLTLERVE